MTGTAADRPDSGTADLTDRPPERPGDTGRPRSDGLHERVRAAAADIEPLVARAQQVQQARATDAKRRGAPRWTDVFTTQFTEFTNRPR